MAILTKHIVDFDDGKCSWDVDYDNVALRLTQIRCDNTQGQYPSRGTATVEANGRTVTRLVAPGDTFSQNLPTGAQTRLGISIDARGRVDGVDWHFEYGPNVS